MTCVLRYIAIADLTFSNLMAIQVQKIDHFVFILHSSLGIN